jgi:hypothetical protein
MGLSNFPFRPWSIENDDCGPIEYTAFFYDQGKNKKLSLLSDVNFYPNANYFSIFKNAVPAFNS